MWSRVRIRTLIISVCIGVLVIQSIILPYFIRGNPATLQVDTIGWPPEPLVPVIQRRSALDDLPPASWRLQPNFAATLLLPPVHLVIAVDRFTIGGLPSLITSAVANTNRPVHAHVFTDGDARMPHAILACTGIYRETAFKVDGFGALPDFKLNNMRGAVSIYSYDPTTIKTVWVPVRPELSRTGNYIRFHMNRLLPDYIDDVIYLDSDVLILKDLQEFIVATQFSETEIGAAVPWETPLSWPVQSIARIDNMMRELRQQSFNATMKSFNAGVMRVNLKLWRQLQLDKEADYWISEQNQGEGQTLWRILGSQMPMQLVAHGRYRPVDDRNWNMFTEEIERRIIKLGMSPEYVASQIDNVLLRLPFLHLDGTVTQVANGTSFCLGLLHATGKEKPYKTGEWQTALNSGRWRYAASIVDMFFNMYMAPPHVLSKCLLLANDTVAWNDYN